MLTTINICTNLIDDPADACQDILSQLKDKPLLKNSVGLIACHPDFVELGVIGAIKASLPFDIIGCCTLGSAVNRCGGLEQLTLTILTSDDVVFSTAFSDPISKNNFEQPIEKVCAEARGALGEEPCLAVVFGPISGEVLGDQMLKKFNQIFGGLPIFGTLANDTSPGYTKSYVFKNGEYDRTKLALLLMRGNINPRFYVTAFSQRNISQNNAVVTGANGYQLSTINGMSVLNYLGSLGISAPKLASITLIPFLVDFGDGTEPVAYNMYDISEAGAYCGGAIPVGSKITFADVDVGSVMETAETTLHAALDDAKKNGAHGIIAIPCACRGIMLSPNIDAEIIKSLEVIGDTIPFSLIYSGGEICPVYDKQRNLVNRFHNLTYTLMVF